MNVGELIDTLTQMMEESDTDENYWGDGEPNRNKITRETPIVLMNGGLVVAVDAAPDVDYDGSYVMNSVRVYILEA